MMDLPYFSVKPVDFDEETRPDEPNYATDKKSETQASTNEFPKIPKGPPTDKDDVWTDAPANKAPDETSFLVGKRLRLTK